MARIRVIHRPMRRGFTLVEAIATIAVLGVLGSIASTILFTASDGYLEAATTSQLHVETSTAMQRITRDIRNIPVVENAPAITSLSATSLHVASPAGAMQLTLQEDTLLLTRDGQTHVLADDVHAFELQAFDDAGNALANTLSGEACEAIRRIVVRITLQRHGVAHTLRSGAFIRATIAL